MESPENADVKLQGDWYVPLGLFYFHIPLKKKGG